MRKLSENELVAIVSSCKINAPEIYNLDTLVVHGGLFHADDVFTSAFLKLINPHITVIRTFKISEIDDKKTLIADIGGGDFDHHQKDEDKVYRDLDRKYPYASFGLVWNKYAPLIFGEKISNIIDNALVKDIDRTDNWGQKEYPNTLSQAISDFNIDWNESDIKADKAFDEAVAFAIDILSRKIKKALSADEAENIVLHSKVKDGTMYLEKFVPYESTVRENKLADRVVFPGQRGGFNVVAIKDNNGNYIKPFPKEWWGAKPNDLPDGISFCHPSGFMINIDNLDVEY